MTAATKLPRHLWTEADERSAVMAWCKVRGIEVDAAPNVTRNYRKNGVKAGRPDLIFAPPRKPIVPTAMFMTEPGPGAAIELKRHDGGNVTAKQLEQLRKLKSLGYRVAICFGADDAMQQLIEWGY